MSVKVVHLFLRLKIVVRIIGRTIVSFHNLKNPKIMSDFSEELYLEMMSDQNESYDNELITEAYTEAFKESLL